MIKPDFNNSILNISASLFKYLGGKTEISGLELVDKALREKEYKNIVFLICDGMGIYNINKLTKQEGFIKNNIQKTLLSTMPATTTNATVSLISCLYPAEHLWLAWNLYIKEEFRAIELFTGKNYYTKNQCAIYDRPIPAYIDRVNCDREISVVAPKQVNYSKKKSIKKVNVEGFIDCFEKLKALINEKGKKFIYSYIDDLDSIMHDFGTGSIKTQAMFDGIQSRLKDVYNNTTDTLFIITADHGHIDVKKYIDIYKDKKVMDMLTRPISMEGRFASFKVENGRQEEFKKYFKKKYGKYFELLSQQELLTQNIYGKRVNEEDVKEYVGDFIAVGNEEFVSLAFYNDTNKFVGAHAGGTKEEMEVPLIILKN